MKTSALEHDVISGGLLPERLMLSGWHHLFQTPNRPCFRVRVDSRNTFPDGLVCVRPPASAEWLWYCVRLWSTSVDQSDSARGVSTPAIAGQASSAQAILRGQVLGTISEGCNTPRVPAHCCIPLRSLYSDISQCDFRRHPQSKAVLMRFALVFSELELLEHRALIMATPDVRRG